MKKDKKWLIERVENYIPLHDKTVRDVVDGILEIIKQLPEMEVLSPEWIENKKWQAYDPDARTLYWAVTETDLENLLVPKQELPVIPKFAADFLDGKEDYTLYELLDGDFIYDNHDELARWLYDNDKETNKERELRLVLAHIYDYTVEKEQKYYAKTKLSKLPVWDDGDYFTTMPNETIEKIWLDVKDFAITKTLEEWKALNITDEVAIFEPEEEEIDNE